MVEATQGTSPRKRMKPVIPVDWMQNQGRKVKGEQREPFTQYEVYVAVTPFYFV
jgi:hypothetical protein